jgi:hypothetical protein
MEGTKKVQPIKPEVKKSPQEFLDAYTKLVKEMGYSIVVSPAWKYSAETKDFRLVLQSSVGQQKNESKN